MPPWYLPFFPLWTCAQQGLLEPSLTVLQSFPIVFAILQGRCWGLSSLHTGFYSAGCGRSARIKRLSGSQPLPFYLPATALTGDIIPNSPFCRVPGLLTVPGGEGPSSSFAVPLSELPAQLISMGVNCAFDLVSLLAEQLLMRSLPSHLLSPFKMSLCGTHTVVLSHCLVLHACHLPPKLKVCLGHGWL